MQHSSKPGATIVVKINGEEVRSVTLNEDKQVKIKATEYYYLKAGDVLEYTEDGITKTLTVPAGKVMLIEYRVVEVPF